MHDVGLAETILLRYCLKHRELSWCQLCIRQMIHEETVRSLARAMEQVKKGRRSRIGGRRHGGCQNVNERDTADPPRASVQDAEEVQQDDHEDRHSCQPKNDISKHCWFSVMQWG